MGQEAWGQVVAKLLGELPKAQRPGQDLVDKAHVLDAADIPARYPNGHAEGAPFENIGALQSKEAIEHARAILDFVRDAMA